LVAEAREKFRNEVEGEYQLLEATAEQGLVDITDWMQTTSCLCLYRIISMTDVRRM
jgi:hypothetical protein